MGARACLGISLTALGMSAVEMWRGFFAPAGMVSLVDGVRLRSMAGPADPDNVGCSSPNHESAAPVRPWAPSAGAAAAGVLGFRGGHLLDVDVTELVDKAPLME
jgi:hypothetical protein